jgi:murein tripeptide amidase MpaA
VAYLNVTEIGSALGALASTYPLFCQLITLPHTTYEGRSCYALRLGNAPAASRDGVLIVGNLHAREWGSADIAINFASDLLEAYTANLGLVYGGKSFTAAQVKAIIEGLNVFVFPCANPDGRYHSQTFDSMWRRNRNPAESGGSPKCIGVDLNRNFDFLWDYVNLYAPAADVVTSTNPCDFVSQTYRGSAAGSEREVQNVVWLLDSYPRIRWLMDVHSYSELVMYPWGDDEDQTTTPSMNFTNPVYNALRGIEADTAYKEYIPAAELTVFQAVTNRVHDAIEAVRGKTYTAQQSYSLYPTSGCSDDYSYSRHFVDPTKTNIGGYCIEWGTEFQPPWSEMEKIILDISAGLVEFCLATPAEGSVIDVDLDTPSLSFHDVPEHETTSRAVVFSVRACPEVTFQITAGPSVIAGPVGTVFGTPLGTSVTLPPSTTPTTPRPARVWISYTGTDAGDTATGTVTIRCLETGGEWTIPISANTIARPTVAVELVLDKSNSMNWESGLTPPLETRVKVLRFSATPLADVIPEGNAIGIVSFDEDAHPVMDVTAVGPLVTGVGRLAARGHITGHTPNPAGWTSIGDGLLLAHAKLAPVTGYDLKATIVLTDGHENRPVSIADASAAINERVYAIGLGTAEVIQPAALTAVTNGTGGYLLLTGALTDDNTFLLSKYYLQILAGVTNAEIVLDPDGWLGLGETHRIPFRLGETDYGSDVILVSPYPRVFRFTLETPGGVEIDPGLSGGGLGLRYAAGQNVSFYRLTLPVSAGGCEAQAGKWHAVLSLDEKEFARYQESLKSGRQEALTHGVHYSLSVQAHSNLTMRARLAQDGYEPGATLTVRAVFTEYGLPVEGRATAQAEMERPDGTRTTLALAEIEAGVFEAALSATLAGVYRFRVLGSGRSLGGTLFTREQLLTGAVWRGGDEPSPWGGNDQGQYDGRLCRLLLCLLSPKTISPKLETRLKRLGVDLDSIRACVLGYCRESGKLEAAFRTAGEFKAALRTDGCGCEDLDAKPLG